MSISRDTLHQLNKGDFESIEEAWLERAQKDPSDLEYFIGVARALSGNGEPKRARTLLEILDEELKRSERWALRLDLLRRTGGQLASGERLHAEVLSTLKKLHAAKPSFQGLLLAVGLQRGIEDTTKTWEKVERLETLLSYDMGAVVWMDGKGVGRVADVNLKLEAFKVDFEKQKGMTVGFRAAGKLMRPLPEDHVQRRKLEDPGTLATLAPTELLGMVLRSTGKPLTAAEVREAVAGLVSENGWTGWWTAARKHPQVVAAGTGSRQTYRWADTAAKAAGAVWKSFDNGSPRQQLDLFRRHGAKDVELRDRMAGQLLGAAVAAATKDPGLAFEIWQALERTGPVPADSPADPKRLVLTADPRALLSGIEDRALRERAYDLLRANRADWREIFLDRMSREDEPRTLDMLFQALSENGATDAARTFDIWLAQPRKAPGSFVWMAERAGENEVLSRNPLRLLQQLLAAMTQDEFAPYRVRLRALAEPGGTVPRLIGRLQEEQALAAREALQRAPGLEGYQRTPLLNALEMRFTSLREPSEQPLYATMASITARRAELRHLLEVEVPTNRKAIEEARALGDLRENFEYKSARQRHEYLSARSASLDRELRRVRPLDPSTVEPTEIRIGTRTRFASQDGGEDRALTILGPWESKPEDGIISYESELAQALLGKVPGDDVLIEGRRFRVTEIAAWSSTAG